MTTGRLSPLLVLVLLVASIPGVAAAQGLDLAGVSEENQQHIKNACGVKLRVHGPAKFYQCVNAAIADLRRTPQPNFSEVSRANQEHIKNACGVKLRVHGPAKFYQCVNAQVSALQGSPAPRVRPAKSRSRGYYPSSRPAASPSPVYYPSTSRGCAENGSCYGDTSSSTGRSKTVRVRGHYRSDGTYVRGHYRSTPSR